MELTGTVHRILPEEQVTEKFKKREFVIKTSDQYNPFILIQTSQAKTTLLDNVRPGDSVKVAINIGGREANNGKVYNTISAWKIEVTGSSIAKPDPMVSYNEQIVSEDLPF